MTDEPGPDENAGRAPKRPRRIRWITVAAVLAYSGLAIGFASVFLPATDTIFLIGMGMFVAAAGPYVMALRETLNRITDRDPRVDAIESLHKSQEVFLAAQEEQLNRLREIAAKIEATTRVFQLEMVEEEVYAGILGVDADDVAFMEWPKDGLRDSVIVYFVEGPAVTYPLTIDQMNQAAETINARMEQHDREDETP